MARKPSYRALKNQIIRLEEAMAATTRHKNELIEETHTLRRDNAKLEHEREKATDSITALRLELAEAHRQRDRIDGYLSGVIDMLPRNLVQSIRQRNGEEHIESLPPPIMTHRPEVARLERAAGEANAPGLSYYDMRNRL